MGVIWVLSAPGVDVPTPTLHRIHEVSKTVQHVGQQAEMVTTHLAGMFKLVEGSA